MTTTTPASAPAHILDRLAIHDAPMPFIVFPSAVVGARDLVEPSDPERVHGCLVGVAWTDDGGPVEGYVCLTGARAAHVGVTLERAAQASAPLVLWCSAGKGACPLDGRPWVLGRLQVLAEAAP